MTMARTTFLLAMLAACSSGGGGDFRPSADLPATHPGLPGRWLVFDELEPEQVTPNQIALVSIGGVPPTGPGRYYASWADGAVPGWAEADGDRIRVSGSGIVSLDAAMVGPDTYAGTYTRDGAARRVTVRRQPQGSAQIVVVETECEVWVYVEQRR